MDTVYQLDLNPAPSGASQSLALQRQVELDQGMGLEKTAAESVLDKDILDIIEKHDCKMKALQEKMMKEMVANSGKLRGLLESKQVRLEGEMEKLESEKRQLKGDLYSCQRDAALAQEESEHGLAQQREEFLRSLREANEMADLRAKEKEKEFDSIRLELELENRKLKDEVEEKGLEKRQLADDLNSLKEAAKISQEDSERQLSKEREDFHRMLQEVNEKAGLRVKEKEMDFTAARAVLEGENKKLKKEVAQRESEQQQLADELDCCRQATKLAQESERQLGQQREELLRTIREAKEKEKELDSMRSRLELENKKLKEEIKGRESEKRQLADDLDSFKQAAQLAQVELKRQLGQQREDAHRLLREANEEADSRAKEKEQEFKSTRTMSQLKTTRLEEEVSKSNSEKEMRRRFDESNRLWGQAFNAVRGAFLPTGLSRMMNAS